MTKVCDSLSAHEAFDIVFRIRGGDGFEPLLHITPEMSHHHFEHTVRAGHGYSSTRSEARS